MYLIRSRSLDNRWLLTPASPGSQQIDVGYIEIIDSGKERIVRLSTVVCLAAHATRRGWRGVTRQLNSIEEDGEWTLKNEIETGQEGYVGED